MGSTWRPWPRRRSGISSAVLNNDMIGNISGVDGVIDNTSFRVFSEPTPVTDDEQTRSRYRIYGGEIDGPSRQIARYVDRVTDQYFTNLDAMMIYRLDRFGRGGHHRPFNDRGFAGVRIMETHENYVRQHQNIRTENGIEYGDVIEGVNFEYAAKLTAVNAVTLASLAWAPPAPDNVAIGGAVQPSTTLTWEPGRCRDAGSDTRSTGGKPRRRSGSSVASWDEVDEFTLENVVIDNYLFGVAAVARDGHESPVVFPSALIQRR